MSSPQPRPFLALLLDIPDSPTHTSMKENTHLCFSNPR